MATQKRRVVYLSDEEWAKAGERAKAFDLSISAYIRKLVNWRQPPTTEQVKEALQRVQRGVGVPAKQVIRAFTPVPKPSQRKHQ